MEITGQLIKTENTLDKAILLAKKAINENKTFSIFLPQYSYDEIMDLYFSFDEDETEDETEEYITPYEEIILKPIIDEIMNNKTIDDVEKEIIISSINSDVNVDSWIILDTDNWVSDDIDGKLYKLHNKKTIQLKEINLITKGKFERDIREVFNDDRLESMDEVILNDNNISEFLEGMTLDLSDYLKTLDLSDCFKIKNVTLTAHVD